MATGNHSSASGRSSLGYEDIPFAGRSSIGDALAGSLPRGQSPSLVLFTASGLCLIAAG